MANEQLPTSDSPTLVSESSSTVQTESESSDGSSDADDDKPIEQNLTDDVQQSSDENDKQSDISEDEDADADEDDANVKDDESKISEQHADEEIEDIGERQPEQVTACAAAAAAAKEVAENDAIDLDEIRYKNLKIVYQGRDILDFSSNVANKSWNIQYAHLPEQNVQMFINNRSQYHRLAAGYVVPENYSLNSCGKCAFHFPVLVNADKPDPCDGVGATASTAGGGAVQKSNVNELLTHTIASIVNRDSPIQSISALAQKLQAQSMASPIHAPNAQAMNLNNFMLNNNAATAAAAAAATSGQSYAYQNQNPNQNQNRNQFAGNTNNYSCAKQNNIGNAFYGNNVMLNALVNQIGNNINNINNSSGFNSNFMNAINGTNNSNLNQLSNAALANLMNQNRQQIYGMCRQNINKSGINFNANSHKPMPTYSHF